MTETSTTIPEASLQPNCVGQITPPVRPQRPMVAEPEQEEPRWSATGCDVEQARLAAARIKEHRGRTMAESCAEATQLWAFGDSVAGAASLLPLLICTADPLTGWRLFPACRQSPGAS